MHNLGLTLFLLNMQNSNSINDGIPVSPSLSPTLEAENFIEWAKNYGTSKN